MPPSFRFIMQPTIVKVGVKFGDMPIVLEMGDIPPGFESFTAQAYVKEAGSGNPLRGHLGGSQFASTVWDEANNKVYFVFGETKIGVRGTFRLGINIRGVTANGAEGLDDLESNPIQVVSHRPRVRSDPEMKAYLDYIRSLM